MGYLILTHTHIYEKLTFRLHSTLTPLFGELITSAWSWKPSKCPKLTRRTLSSEWRWWRSFKKQFANIGIDNAQTYGHLGHPASIPSRLSLRWAAGHLAAHLSDSAAGCHEDNSLLLWQSGRKQSISAERRLRGELQEKIQYRSVASSRSARRPSRIWCCLCPLRSRPKEVASCQLLRSFSRSVSSVWLTLRIWSHVKNARRRHVRGIDANLPTTIEVFR